MTRVTIHQAVLAAVLVLAGTVVPPCSGASATPEYQLKAAFLLNFANFVEWPAAAFAAPSDPLVLGVFGKDPFDGALQRGAQARVVRGRRILVRFVTDLESLRGCHIVFFPAAEMHGYTKVASAISDLHILTVGEIPGFTDRGGTINFVIDDGRVRFEINSVVAEHRQLKMSSKLLQLAVFAGRERQ
jgi:hypothetical protein